MLGDLFDWLFTRTPPSSREDVKRRLQLVLAHDRADLPPHLMEQMRQEILDVVSRYLEIDRESMEFSLASDQRITALVANVPIRRIRDRGEPPESEIITELSAMDVSLDDSDHALDSGDLTQRCVP